MFEKRAMLVELTIRRWTARKHDKSATLEVDQRHNAQNAGRYNKQLIDKAALEPINNRTNALRLFHYAYTLPWGNNGQRLLPAVRFMEYRSVLAKHKARFDQEVSTFLANYPQWTAAASSRLGSLYDPADYPSTDALRASFGIDFEIFPVPSAGDFRVDVAEEERAELAAQIEAATTERQAMATRACYVRVRDVLQRVKNQCVEGKTRITESLVGDIHDLAGMLDDLNISGDPELTRVSSEIKRDLLVDAEDLRRHAPTRKAVGDRASELLDSITWGYEP